jgi:nucleolar protein 58
MWTISIKNLNRWIKHNECEYIDSIELTIFILLLFLNLFSDIQFNSINLQKFAKFKNTAEALKSSTALMKSKLSKTLKSFLSKQIVEKGLEESLALSDSKLGSIIKDKLGIQCVVDTSVNELIRCIRSQMNNLITGISETDMNSMSLGLSHSLSRYKLKFSPDKVDTMIVQAIGNEPSTIIKG